MEPTREELTKHLTSLGFHGSQRDPLGSGMMYWRRINTPNVCLDNERLQIVVTLHEVPYNEGHCVARSMSFDIQGSYKPGAWVKLQTYAVSWADGMAGVETFQAELLRAWDAMYVGQGT